MLGLKAPANAARRKDHRIGSDRHARNRATCAPEHRNRKLDGTRGTSGGASAGAGCGSRVHGGKRAFLRRWGEVRPGARPRQAMRDRYAIGEVRIEPETRGVTVGDRPVALREREFLLLRELARKPGHVITRD